jgi:phosphopantothenate--cysteine ligase
LNILITSGGTKIPIDSVRSITNMSKGTFGAKLAKEFLNRKNFVTFLTHKSARTPMKTEINLDEQIDFNSLLEKYQWAQSVSSYYDELQYDTFWEYADCLERIIKDENPDAVILAAAASDYETNPTDGKVRTSAQMNIELKALPKLISKIRNEWNYGGVLVGFKLLVGSTEEELVESARKSVVENQCDFVIANDLNDVKAGNHKITIVRKYENYNVPKNKAVESIVNNVEILCNSSIRNNR